MFADDPATPFQGLKPQPELWLLVLEEYFSHPAEQMHMILAEKEGPALQLCSGRSHHIPAHAAVTWTHTLACLSHAPTLPRHREQPKVSRPWDLWGLLPPHGSQTPVTPAGQWQNVWPLETQPVQQCPYGHDEAQALNSVIFVWTINYDPQGSLSLLPKICNNCWQSHMMYSFILTSKGLFSIISSWTIMLILAP